MSFNLNQGVNEKTDEQLQNMQNTTTNNNTESNQDKPEDKQNKTNVVMSLDEDDDEDAENIEIQYFPINNDIPMKAGVYTNHTTPSHTFMMSKRQIKLCKTFLTALSDKKGKEQENVIPIYEQRITEQMPGHKMPESMVVYDHESVAYAIEYIKYHAKRGDKPYIENNLNKPQIHPIFDDNVKDKEDVKFINTVLGVAHYDPKNFRQLHNRYQTEADKIPDKIGLPGLKYNKHKLMRLMYLAVYLELDELIHLCCARYRAMLFNRPIEDGGKLVQDIQFVESDQV
jgi:hypothetical protein